MKKFICVLFIIVAILFSTLIIYAEDETISFVTKDYSIVETISDFSSSYRIEVENYSWIEAAVIYPSVEDVELLSNLVYGEGNGLSNYEKSLIVWCVLNRVDSDKFPNSIEEVVKQKSQFYGYNINNPVTEENRLLVNDVLIRYYNNFEGRTLPIDYLFFYGDGKHNYYRKNYKDKSLFKFEKESVYN